LAVVATMNDKCKSTSQSAIQVKNWWKAICIEEKLDVISRLEKGERIVHICHNVMCPLRSVHTIGDNADSYR
jgi:hypothetical protein